MKQGLKYGHWYRQDDVMYELSLVPLYIQPHPKHKWRILHEVDRF